jgi:hypothetical protein
VVKFEKVRPWCEELDRGLAQTFGHDHDAIVAGVNSGYLEAYRMWDGAAYMVTRVEKGVLTVCCYQGERVVEAMRWMNARSRMLGLHAIVFYTRRPGLARLLKEFDFQLDDYVFRADFRPAREEVA